MCYAILFYLVCKCIMYVSFLASGKVLREVYSSSGGSSSSGSSSSNRSSSSSSSSSS